jgi:2-polyprenyl-3-methyl-5-hydroxy-6-metoxy-1,4-benzoquinol methylase
LDAFVRETDDAGGPESPGGVNLWNDFHYQATVQVDQTLDPYSDLYWQQQVQLYREITGREINQSANEVTHFELEDHVRSANSYASNDPARMALHYCRLSKLVKWASLPPNARVLDLGCGWGLSSEFFALLGCRVTAVDINERFVELIRRRSNRFNFGIEVIHSDFDSLDLDKQFDVVIFYESLHHALRPWDLLQKVSSWLAVDGKIALAGEPIQSIWWHNWGLRLDPVSVYCMRKFGWFESGWSKEFIVESLNRCGLITEYKDSDPEVGPIIIASRGAVPRPSMLTSALVKKSIAGRAAVRLEILRRAFGLIRQALSLSFLFRR